MATTICIGSGLQAKQQPQLHGSLPSMSKVFHELRGAERSVTPLMVADVSPGGSSVCSSDRPMPDELFDYCEDCKNHLLNVNTYSEHVILCHLRPKRLPSASYYETVDKSEDLLKRPYTTLYPSKKRKPDSDRVPRPQNQYMIFSNYIRTPLMRFFGDINHAQISQAISTVWKKLDENQKQPFKEESKQCENIHKQEFPTYKYKPKQKKAKKPEVNNTVPNRQDNSPQTSDDLSPAECTKFFDPTTAGNGLFVNVNDPSVTGLQQQSNTTYIPGRNDFSQPITFSQYSPVGEAHGFAPSQPRTTMSEMTTFQAYGSPQAPLITNLSDGSIMQHAKSGPMFIKRDPILSQNAAPQLTSDVPISVASSWPAGLSNDFSTVDSNAQYIVMQGGGAVSLNEPLVVPTTDLALACSASSDQSISDNALLPDLKITNFNVNNQPMDIDHPRDHLNAFDASSLPNYDIHDKKDLLDQRDPFDYDLIHHYDDHHESFMNSCAM